MKEYYYSDGQKQLGPFKHEELKEKKITKETLVWCEGMVDWQKASEVEELKFLFASIPPPIKKPVLPPIKKPVENTQPPIQQTANTANIVAPSIEIKKAKTTRNIIIAVVIVIVLAIATVLLYNYYHTDNDSSSSDNSSSSSSSNSSGSSNTNTQVQDNRSNDQQLKLTQRKNYLINNWSAFIYAERSNYTYNKLGGIYDLYITVTNETEFVIDYVIVCVSYWKANNQLYGRETLYFENIQANSWLKKQSPNSERGVDVTYSIKEVYSQSLGLHYSIK